MNGELIRDPKQLLLLTKLRAPLEFLDRARYETGWILIKYDSPWIYNADLERVEGWLLNNDFRIARQPDS